MTRRGDIYFPPPSPYTARLIPLIQYSQKFQRVLNRLLLKKNEQHNFLLLLLVVVVVVVVIQ